MVLKKLFIATVFIVTSVICFAAPDPARFSNLANFPASKAEVLDFFAHQRDGLCYEKTIRNKDASYKDCMLRAEELDKSCRISIGAKAEEWIDSAEEFKRIGLNLMKCLAPDYEMPDS